MMQPLGPETQALSEYQTEAGRHFHSQPRIPQCFHAHKLSKDKYTDQNTQKTFPN